MALTAVDGRPNVQEYEDMVAIWAGQPEDPTGLALYPAAAFEVARDILALMPGGGAARTDVVQGFQIFPPAGEGLTGKLRVRLANGEHHDLLVDWASLVGLAETAQAALMASPAGGRS